MGMTRDELIETFSLLDDWEERYGFVISLGEDMPEMDDVMKTDNALVPGCTSRVWMVPDLSKEGVFDFYGDSDAHIVKGLIAVLKILYGGMSMNDVKTYNIDAVFAELGLNDHLSPNRRNGFNSMVGRIQSYVS